MNWSAVREWKPGPWQDWEARLQQERRTALAQADELDQAKARLAGAYGDTADAARAELGRQLAVLDDMIGDLSETLLAVAEFADAVWQVQTLVREVEFELDRRQLTMRADGSVTVPDWLAWEPDPRARAVKQQIIKDVESMAANVVSLAEAADAELARRLTAVADGSYRSIETHRSFTPGLPDAPDPNWSASQVAAWWAALTDAEKQAIITGHPEWIGNLDGIDAASRDQANRILLAKQLAKAQAEVDEYLKNMRLTEPLPTRGVPPELLDKLNALKAIADTLADPRFAADAKLLLLDLDHGMPKAAIALGDVDHAKNVVTYVPGINTNVAEWMRYYTNQVSNIRSQAGGTNQPAPDLAAIAWLGYDEPTYLTTAQTWSAGDGADKLNRFTEGIQASRLASGAGDPHQTVFGHSYGSTTAGMAVRDVRTGTVDDLIMIGSPGSGAQTVGEYNLTPGHAWVSGMDNGDAVQGIGPDAIFGRNPMKMPGVTHLSGNGGGPHPGSIPLFDRHMSYLDPGSDTLMDIAKVIMGQR